MTKPTRLEFEFTGPLEEAKQYLYDTLKDNGFYDVEDSQIEPNLTTQIHSLFGRERFSGFDDDEYDKMEPALKLASLFIQDRRAVKWFYGLVEGEAKSLSDHPDVKYLAPKEGKVEGSKGTGKRGEKEKHRRPTERDRKANWDSLLSEVSRVIQWHLYPHEKPFDMEIAFTILSRGAMNYTLEHGGEHPTRKVLRALGEYKDAEKETLIETRALDNAGKRHFASISAPEVLSDERNKFNLMIQFNFAVTLVHELAHIMRHFPTPKPLYDSLEALYLEPWYNQEEAYKGNFENVELGFSWEYSMFEDIPWLSTLTLDNNWQWHQQSRLSDPEREFLILRQLGQITKDSSVKPLILKYKGVQQSFEPHGKYWNMNLVPLGWIARWFQQSHWDNKKEDIRRTWERKWRIDLWAPTKPKGKELNLVHVDIEIQDKSQGDNSS